jgi:hypothetical protein
MEMQEPCPDKRPNMIFPVAPTGPYNYKYKSLITDAQLPFAPPAPPESPATYTNTNSFASYSASSYFALSLRPVPRVFAEIRAANGSSDKLESLV